MKRLNVGEDLAAVTLYGPSAGHAADSCYVLIGPAADLAAMLDS